MNKLMKKKGLVILGLIGFFGIFSLNTNDTFAATKKGDFYIDGNVKGVHVNNNRLTIKDGGSYTISTKGKMVNGSIIVQTPKKVNVILKDVRLKNKNDSALSINNRIGANLIINGDNSLSGDSSAISYRGNESVIIDGKGKMRTASNKDDSINVTNGSLVVKGGTILASNGINARELKISGGQINGDTKNSVLRNQRNERVFKQEISLNNAPKKKISSLLVKNINGKKYKYASNGIFTDKNSKMNVFLPRNTAVLSANVGGRTYSLENTAKLIESSENRLLPEKKELASDNVLRGTTAPIIERLKESNLSNQGELIKAVSNVNSPSYTLLSSDSNIPKRRVRRDVVSPPAPSVAQPNIESGLAPSGSVIYIPVQDTGTKDNSAAAAIPVNGKVDIQITTAEKQSGGNTDELKKLVLGKVHDFDTATVTINGQQKQKYTNLNYKYDWTTGKGDIVSLQAGSAPKTLAEALKPGKSLIKCEISATYDEVDSEKVPIDKGGKDKEKEIVDKVTTVQKQINGLAFGFVTIFVMPDITGVTLDPTSLDITVGGSVGGSTRFLNAKVTGMTDSAANELTAVTIKDVEYSWRQILPSGVTGSFLNIMYDDKNIDASRPENMKDGKPINFVKSAASVSIIGTKEAQNVRVGVTAHLKYSFKDPRTQQLSTVETTLPEIYSNVNVSDKSALVLTPKELNLKTNSLPQDSVANISAIISGIDTSLVSFKWWEYSGPSKTSYIDFSNRKGVLAEEDAEGMKTLPVITDNKEQNEKNIKAMTGIDGASVTVQALEPGVTYLYVQAEYTNRDTKTMYKKDGVVKITITDAQAGKNGSGNGNGGSNNGGNGQGGGKNGANSNNGKKGTGNGDLVISDLPNVLYNTKPHTPRFTVKSGINLLRQGVDYDYTFLDNTDVGTATLYIDGKNQYAGIYATKTFTISKADMKIKDPIIVINTLKALNYTYDLSKLLPKDMTTIDKLNTSYSLGKSTLPTTNFQNITNGGNTPILSFDARGITTAGVQGVIPLKITSEPNYNPADINITVRAEDKIKVVFHPENGSDVFTQDVDEGQKVKAPNAPTKADAKFRGWYRADGTQWDFERDVVKGTIDLYAAYSDSDVGVHFITGDIKDGRLSQSLIDDAVAKHRDLKLNDLGDDGKIKAQWLFLADSLGKYPAKDYDLRTDIYNAEDSPAFGLLSSNDDGEKGVGLTFGTNGLFPSGALVNVNVADKFGVTKGDNLYLYKYDTNKNKLLTLPRRSKIMVDNAGYARIPVIDSGDYVLALKRGKSSSIVTLKNQIRINKIKTARKGQRRNISVYAPATLKKVASFDKRYPYYYGGYKLNYSSSNKKIAAVSKNGSVKFKKKGTVDIKTNITLYNGTKRTVIDKIKVK